MRIEVIAIGDELLAGFTVNRNAAFVGRALFEAGYYVGRQTALPDDPVALRSGLTRALEESDLVICTGGLGPTLDDNTRQCVAELVGSEFVLNEEVRARLTARYGPDFPSLDDQATIPEMAIPLHNLVGTAPGLLFHLGEKLLILLPGVPVEMEALLIEQVIPLLPPAQADVMESLHFFQTREVDIDVALRELASLPIKIGIYPHLGAVTVRLSATSAAEIAPVCDHLMAHFGDRYFAAPTLEEAVHELALAKKITISTAESCTAGGIAAHLTRRSGSSEFFAGGIIAYSNTIKEQLLNVSPETLTAHGAVSEETAREMVVGALQVTGSDYAIATSGICGPSGGTPEKPVGTVCFAVGNRDKIVTSTCHFRGNRPAITHRSILHALSVLLVAIR